ncbi:MAG TPA: hypothetical protein PKN86_11820 [Candidatus Obscuribacter sp.]|nr:hypothetical protein [Candidatus Obscuribacter sp.]HMX47817.1 hypothetical protein [Candidatus Obscuribacter sp.]HNA74661.1 hypothetical protein [Candidatus Obscuribacter sp.]HND07717.1 hypothetical protein [Candidatus Obscuribacter sp.]HND69907.1 hypothetical protein [Candidatus Obscuribacter sp.]
MNNSVDTKSALFTVAKIYLAADILWATVFATFTGSLLSSGVDLANCGPSELGQATPGLVAGTLLAFMAALFQGAIFLIVFTGFGIAISLAVKKIFKTEAKVLWQIGRWVLGALCGWALLASTVLNSFFNLGLGMVGSLLGCTSAIHLGFFGSAAAWIITFVSAFIQGTIFLLVGSGFVFFFLVVISLVLGKKNQDSK